MRVITAPNMINRAREVRPLVFLAGGITNCPEWQFDLIKRFESINKGTILNPRRKEFPMDDPSAVEEQIAWEYTTLTIADIIIFYFCKETLNPIVLFELGAFHNKPNTEIIICCDPEYKRIQDVKLQMRVRGIYDILYSFDQLIINLDKKIKEWRWSSH